MQKHYISVDSEYLGRYILDAKVVLWRAESPNVAHSPGQRPGETLAAINTFGIFALAQKCHAPKARNQLTPHGALPLIMQAALSERDTLINASTPTQGVALGYGQHLGFQPATNNINLAIPFSSVLPAKALSRDD